MNTLVNITGGCQCGAVRYALRMTPQKTHYCHCRMCQRAVGNLFAALTGVRKDQIEWTRGASSYYASSSVARRGFCAQCGTPLSFDYHHSQWIYLTVGSLDRPEQVTPEKHYGVESRLPWLNLQDDLPQKATDENNDKLAGMTVRQYDPRAAKT
ncbi:MAG: GFA family protein [Stenotrophobium sp.]